MEVSTSMTMSVSVTMAMPLALSSVSQTKTYKNQLNFCCLFILLLATFGYLILTTVSNFQRLLQGRGMTSSSSRVVVSSRFAVV